MVVALNNDEYEALVARTDSVAARCQELELENEALRAMHGRTLEALRRRLELEDQSRALKIDVRVDTSDLDLQTAIIEKLMPGLPLEGKSAEYLGHMYDLVIEQEGKKRQDGNAASQRATVVELPMQRMDQNPANSASNARLRMLTRV